MGKQVRQIERRPVPGGEAGRVGDFRTLAELSHDLIVRIDRDYQVSYVNPAYERFAISLAEVLGKPLSASGLPQAVVALCEACLAEAFERKHEISWEFDCAAGPEFARGVGIHFHARALPEADDHGHFDTVLMVLHDATAEHDMDQSLRESAQRYRSIVERNHDGVFALDTSGRFIEVNAACTTLTGYSAEELLQKSFMDLCAPDSLEAARRDFQESLSSGPGENLVAAILRKDGQRVELLVTGGPIVVDGKVVAIHAAAEDITRLQVAQAQERRARQQAQAALAAKDRFLAVLSHELRTPLSPIVITAHLLESNAAFPAEVREAAATIRRNAELEARIVDDLLDVTRISRGKIHLHATPIDMHEQIDRVVARCQNDLRARKLTLTVRLEAGDCHVHGDPTRLQQILWNLLKNALKFTPAKGRITVSTDNDSSGRLRIDIADTGVGIKPDVLPHIFSPFEQGDPEVTRLFGGLGLGLSISKGLAELHGGSVVAASAGPGQGSTFTLSLPVLRDFDPAEVASATDGEEPAGSLRVLLVEDHVDTIRTMTRLLDSHGHSVRTADCLAAALRAAAAETFDLLISDIGLPDGSGLDLMRQLHAQYALKGIALSGFGTEEDLRKSKEAGFAAHLTKPVNLKELERVIRRTVGR